MLVFLQMKRVFIPSRTNMLQSAVTASPFSLSWALWSLELLTLAVTLRTKYVSDKLVKLVLCRPTVSDLLYLVG